MGAQLAARVAGVNDSIVASMTQDTWAIEALRNVESGRWPETLCNQIIAAGKAVESFRSVLSYGEISGFGSHVRRGEPAPAVEPITSQEWGMRYINIWKNRLEAPAGSDPDHFPPLNGVLVHRFPGSTHITRLH
jgi:hypothetical protein